MTVEEFDRRHFGEHKFSTVYDKLTSVAYGGNRHRQRASRKLKRRCNIVVLCCAFWPFGIVIYNMLLRE